MDYESDEGRRYGGLPLWHHLDCFAKLRNDLKFWSSGAKLSGFKSLGKEDQIKVEELLPEIQPCVLLRCGKLVKDECNLNLFLQNKRRTRRRAAEKD